MNLREIVEKTRQQQRRGKELVATLSDEQLNARPDSDTWSIGMQLDHIAVVVDKASTELEEACDGGLPAGDPAAWKPNLLERKFIEMVGAQPGGRTNPVPKGFEPSESHLDASVLSRRYEAALDRLCAVMERCQSADLKRVRASSAAVPWIKFSIGAWFAAMVVHTDYHLDKAAKLYSPSV